MNIKPIDTRYGGYLFRSRLEARWAVFFNKFRMCKWTYEEEGLDLPSGWYLPDFRLKAKAPGADCIIEIKPTRDYGDMSLAGLQFGREILAAQPTLGYLIFYGDPVDVFDKGWLPSQEHVWAPEPTGDEKFNWPAVMLLVTLQQNWSRAQTAAAAAREARFEHGATP